MAQRLGMPQSVIAAARGYLSDDQKRLQAHLSRLDAQARALESERTKLERDKRAFNETNAELTKREKSLAEREEVFKKRLNERLDERLRQAKRDVDAVIDQLKEKSEALAEKASLRAVINTGETGSARAEARAEIDRIVEDLRHPALDVGRRPLKPALSKASDPRSRIEGDGRRTWARRRRSLNRRQSSRSRCARKADPGEGQRAAGDRRSVHATARRDRRRFASMSISSRARDC